MHFLKSNAYKIPIIEVATVKLPAIKCFAMEQNN